MSGTNRHRSGFSSYNRVHTFCITTSTLSPLVIFWQKIPVTGPLSSGFPSVVQSPAAIPEVVLYRGTSPIKKCLPPSDLLKTLGIGLRQCPRGVRFLISEVTLSITNELRKLGLVQDAARGVKIQRYLTYQKPHPPLNSIESWEWSYCRALEECCFL